MLMVDEPLYISEEILESMNPNFSDFDLLNCDDDTLRLNALVIRIYAKHHTEINYSLLIDYNVALCCLQYIGKDVTPFHDSTQFRLGNSFIRFLKIPLLYNSQMDFIQRLMTLFHINILYRL